jgi:hypothetical protein
MFTWKSRNKRDAKAEIIHFHAHYKTNYEDRPHTCTHEHTSCNMIKITPLLPTLAVYC